MQITVKQGQSFYDVVLEATGDIANAALMAKANNIAETDHVEAGTQLRIAGTVRTAEAATLRANAPATVNVLTSVPNAIDYLLPQIFPIQ